MARLRLGEFLIQHGLIDEMQLNAALAHQRQWGGFLGQILVDHGFVDEMDMYRALAAQLGLDLVCIPDLRPSPNVARALPTALCQEKALIPVGVQERTLLVATSMPQDVQVQDDIAFRTGLKIRYVLAPHREIEWAIRFYHYNEGAPCPPPKVKRHLPSDDEFKIVDAAGHTVMKSVDQLRREHEARQSGAMPGAPGPAPAQPPPGGMSQDDVVAMRASFERQITELKTALEKQNGIVRSLVELCVQKGLFQREELLALLQRR